MELLTGWRFPAALQPVIDRIHPRDVAVFHGHMNLNQVNFIEKWMIGKVKSPVGDFRDWKAITAWAAKIADDLKKAENA